MQVVDKGLTKFEHYFYSMHRGTGGLLTALLTTTI